MEQMTDYPETLCADEAVCFIAGRHNVTPRQLLNGFLLGKIETEKGIPLEPNEIEILRGLSGVTGKNKNNN